MALTRSASRILLKKKEGLCTWKFGSGVKKEGGDDLSVLERERPLR